MSTFVPGLGTMIMRKNEFMDLVDQEALDLHRILKFVNDNLDVRLTKDNNIAMLLAKDIANSSHTAITTHQYISAQKYLSFINVAKQSSINGKTLWQAVVENDTSHYWQSYLN